MAAKPLQLPITPGRTVLGSPAMQAEEREASKALCVSMAGHQPLCRPGLYPTKPTSKSNLPLLLCLGGPARVQWPTLSLLGCLPQKYADRVHAKTRWVC